MLEGPCRWDGLSFSGWTREALDMALFHVSPKITLGLRTVGRHPSFGMIIGWDWGSYACVLLSSSTLPQAIIGGCIKMSELRLWDWHRQSTLWVWHIISSEFQIEGSKICHDQAESDHPISPRQISKPVLHMMWNVWKERNWCIFSGVSFTYLYPPRPSERLLGQWCAAAWCAGYIPLK
jgi:hypothetical protein